MDLRGGVFLPAGKTPGLPGRRVLPYHHDRIVCPACSQAFLPASWPSHLEGAMHLARVVCAEMGARGFQPCDRTAARVIEGAGFPVVMALGKTQLKPNLPNMTRKWETERIECPFVPEQALHAYQVLAGMSLSAAHRRQAIRLLVTDHTLYDQLDAIARLSTDRDPKVGLNRVLAFLRARLRNVQGILVT